MEPIGLAVGVIGLAGLFSACLDAVERFDSWKSFSDDSRALGSRWETQRLRMKRWGQAVGFGKGGPSPDHHEALEDPEIALRVREHLSIIENLCTNAGGAFSSSAAETNPRQSKNALFSRGRSQAHPSHPSPLSESGRQRVKWALRDKAKCTAKVEMLGLLVQDLHDLVPLDGTKSTKDIQQKAGCDALGHMDDKFSGKDPWSAQLDEILARIEEDLEAETRKKVHAWLLGRDIPNELFDDAVQRRVEGTCNWILEQSSFLEWTGADFPASSAKILWINGARGFGKTILCARVVEYLRGTLDMKPAHFFFSSDFESRRDPFIAVRSWLIQLLSHPTVFDLAWKEWVADDSQVATRSDIVRIFRKTVVAVPGCTFILDGLDECAGMGQAWDADNTTSVATFLETVQQAANGTNTRILIVCRDEPEIRQSILCSEGLRWCDFKISSDHVQADNALFSRSIVDKKLKNKPETIKSDISMRLASRCNGQFLWIKMLEPSLRSGKNKKQLEAAIDTSPDGLDHLYDRDWQRLLGLSKLESSRAISLLRWAAFALRPLTIVEITEALLITGDDSDFPVSEMPDSIDEDYIEGEILGLCGSLVEIRNVASESGIGSRTLHLAHFSVKEFFISRMSHDASIIVANEHLRKSTEKNQHNMLAIMCLRYVNFPSVWKGPHNEAGQGLMSFLHYAADSWYQHAATSKPYSNDMVQLTNAFFNECNEQYCSWGRWYDLSEKAPKEGEAAVESTTSSPLYYASLLSLTETVDFLIGQRKYNINETTSSGTTALVAACIGGDARIVAMLLKEGADLTIASDEDLRPLFAASIRGHAEIVRLLLEKEANVMDIRKDGWTPLLAASAHGHIEVVRQLLEKPTEAINTRKDGWTALLFASSKGYVEVVRLLLEKGADVTAATNSGYTSLHFASSNGYFEIVQILLEKGDDAMTLTDDGYTSLHFASSNGYIKIVQILLEKGGDATTTTRSGYTSLHNASINGHSEIIQLLLRKGADIKAATKSGWTSLHYASIDRHPKTVQLLLENGADVTATSKDKRTALHIASRNGHIEIIQLLLKNGADVSAMDKNKGTALHVASRNENIKIVQLLVEMGADITAAKTDGSTSLQIASKQGQVDTVRLLLEKGADMTARCAHRQTLLHAASMAGQIEMVQFLLENAVDVEAVDIADRTALFLACIKGHERVVEQLLLHKAEPYRTDRYGATPLFAATRNAHEKVVACLLALECDIGGFCDGFGRTLLWWASKSGSAAIIDMILQFAERKGFHICSADLGTEPRLTGVNPSLAFCDICTRTIYEGDAYYECAECQGGDLYICQECLTMDAKCYNESHVLSLRHANLDLLGRVPEVTGRAA